MKFKQCLLLMLFYVGTAFTMNRDHYYDEHLSGNDSDGCEGRSNENDQGALVIGVNFSKWKSIEDILAEENISPDDITPIKTSDESLDLIHTIFKSKDDNEKELAKLYEQLPGESDCLSDFKKLKKHMWDAPHKEYNKEMPASFITTHKQKILAFKKTDPELDMIRELNSIYFVHHSI